MTNGTAFNCKKAREKGPDRRPQVSALTKRTLQKYLKE